MARLALGVVAVVVGVVAVLAIGLVVLLQTGAVSRRVKDLVVPRASAALGRELTVRDAKLRIVPELRVDLVDAAIAGRAGEPPLVELAALQVSLRLWPLVRSLGRDIGIDTIRLARPVVNLVCAPDGTWNYEGLGKEGGAQPAPAAPPAGTDQRKLVVAKLAIEDGSVRVIDRAAQRRDTSVAISQIQLSAEHVGVGEPLHVTLSAAIAGADRNFQAELGADRVPASVAELGPGTYPKLDGTVKLTGLDLRHVRAFLPPSVTGMMTGGRVEAQAKLSTQGETYRLDGSGKLGQVKLRWEPAEGSFELHATIDPATSALHADVEKLVLKGPGVDLGGKATLSSAGAVKRAPPTRIRFAIAGPLLDLGHVFGVLPASESKAEPGPLVTEAQRRAIESLDVSGTVDIAKVARGAFVANGLKATARLEKGAFVLHDAHADFFGGKVDASGTRFDLAPAVPTWTLKTKLEGIDLGQAFGALAGTAPLLGKVHGALALDGAGLDWPTLRKALTGEGAISVKDGALTTADVGKDVLGAVAQGLQAAGKNAAAGAVTGASGKTQLRDLTARFTVKDGAMALSQPLSFTSAFGAAKLGGRIGLDGQLGLQGTATLTKEVLARIVAPAGLPAPAALDVPLGLGGSLVSPAVNVDAQGAVAGLVTGAARQQVQQLQNRAEDEAKRAARRGLGDVLHRFGR